MNLVNRQSSRQNALLTASKGVDYKNNIYLLKERKIFGSPSGSQNNKLGARATFLGAQSM